MTRRMKTQRESKQGSFLALWFSLLILWTLLFSLFLSQWTGRRLIRDQYHQHPKPEPVTKIITASKAASKSKSSREDSLPLQRYFIEDRRHHLPRVISYPFQGQTMPYFSNSDRLMDLIPWPPGTTTTTTAKRPRFLTTQSGCRMARWVVPTLHVKPRYRDCWHSSRLFSANNKLLTEATIRQVQPGDTIYVTFLELEHFCQNLLDRLTVDVVVISGQIQKVAPVPEEIIDRLLDAPHVLAWCCQNLPMYVPARHLGHAKVHSFPYGLKEAIQRPSARNAPLFAFETVFWETWPHPIKNQTLYVGPMAETSPTRSKILQAQTRTKDNHSSMEVLDPLDYMREVARSHYILSPNGDRPECYRHYEAIGLGTIPITELSRAHFRHLAPASVIFETTDWNLTQWKDNPSHHVSVNRMMILEEYWMEYVDWQVGRVLQWWNVARGEGMFIPELFRAEYLH